MILCCTPMEFLKWSEQTVLTIGLRDIYCLDILKLYYKHIALTQNSPSEGWCNLWTCIAPDGNNKADLHNLCGQGILMSLNTPASNLVNDEVVIVCKMMPCTSMKYSPSSSTSSISECLLVQYSNLSTLLLQLDFHNVQNNLYSLTLNYCNQIGFTDTSMDQGIIQVQQILSLKTKSSLFLI